MVTNFLSILEFAMDRRQARRNVAESANQRENWQFETHRSVTPGARR
jgi:hypothetical protein